VRGAPGDLTIGPEFPLRRGTDLFEQASLAYCGLVFCAIWVTPAPAYGHCEKAGVLSQQHGLFPMGVIYREMPSGGHRVAPRAADETR